MADNNQQVRKLLPVPPTPTIMFKFPLTISGYQTNSNSFGVLVSNVIKSFSKALTFSSLCDIISLDVKTSILAFFSSVDFVSVPLIPKSFSLFNYIKTFCLCQDKKIQFVLTFHN